MKENNIKQRATSGFIWSIGERFGNLIADFVISIFLARILSPKEFGIIAMVGVFTMLLSPFVDSGLGKALIRKKEVTNEDYSTVFWWNIGMSSLIYFIIFFSAPLISDFYNEPLLTDVVRVIGLITIFQSLNMVQSTKLTKELNFKTLTLRSLLSNIPAGLIGLYLASAGWSYWALVARLVANSVISTALLWTVTGWRPTIQFNVKSFKEFFGFGSKMLLSSLLDTFFKNIYPLVIGRFFSTADLGVYSRAKSFVGIPQNIATQVSSKVTYPIFAEMQASGQNLKSGYRRMIMLVSYAYFPLLMLVMGLSYTIVLIMLTEKWIATVPILKGLALAGMLYPLHSINLNVLTVNGRSDLFLYLEIAKKVMILLIITATFQFGLMGLVYGQVFQTWVAYLINSYFTKRFINYSFFQQILDILPNLIISIMMGFGLMYLSEKFKIYTWWSIPAWGLVGLIFYFLVNYVRRSTEQSYILEMVMARFKRNS